MFLRVKREEQGWEIPPLSSHSQNLLASHVLIDQPFRSPFCAISISIQYSTWYSTIPYLARIYPILFSGTALAEMGRDLPTPSVWLNYLLSTLGMLLMP